MQQIKKNWKKNLDSLTPEQHAKYEDTLEVLNLMRHGRSLTNASKQVRISPSTVKKYAGNALEFYKRAWTVKKFDRLARRVRIYENGVEVWITIRGNKQAMLLGRYHSAIGRFAKDESSLRPFKKTRIKDIDGKIHRLETNMERILAILERHEDAEFFSIYSK